MRYLYVLLFVLASGGQSWGQVSLYGFSKSTAPFASIKDSAATIVLGGFTATGEFVTADISTLQTFPAGFTFRYNGQPYTNFTVSPNGFMRLGTTAITGGNLTPISAGTDNNILSPFARDLTLGFLSNAVTFPASSTAVTTSSDLTPFLSVGDSIYSIDNDNYLLPDGRFARTVGAITPTSITLNAANGTTASQGSGGNPRQIVGRPGYVRMALKGTGTNRMLVIEWDVARANSTTLFTNEHIRFQIKLYETTNVIEFHYGNNAGLTGTGFTHEVGLRGSAGSDINVLNMTSGTNWSTAISTTSASSRLYTETSSIVTSGQIFRFTPPVCQLTINAANSISPTVVNFTDPTSFAANIAAASVTGLCSGSITASLAIAGGAAISNATWTLPSVASNASSVVYTSATTNQFNFNIASGVCAGNYTSAILATSPAPAFTLQTPAGAQVISPSGSETDALAVCESASALLVPLTINNNSADPNEIRICSGGAGCTLGAANPTTTTPSFTLGTGSLAGATATHRIQISNSTTKCKAERVLGVRTYVRPVITFPATTICENLATQIVGTITTGTGNSGTGGPTVAATPNLLGPATSGLTVNFGTPAPGTGGGSINFPILQSTENTTAADLSQSYSVPIQNNYTIGAASLACTSTGNFSITVKPAPVVEITTVTSGTSVNTQTISTCEGVARTLYANSSASSISATSYAWSYPSGSNGLTNTTTATTSTFNNSGQTANATVRLTGTVNGCSGIADVVLNQTPAPNPTINTFTGTQTQNSQSYSVITVCAGGSINLSVPSCAPSCATYSWEYDNSTISNGASAPSGSYNNSLAFNTSSYFYSPPDSRFWNLRGTGANGCAYSKIFVVSVLSNPSVSSVVTSSNTVCAGNDLTVTANVSVSPARTYSYAWNPSSGTNANVIVSSFDVAGNRNFDVTVTDDLGCTTTAASNTVTVSDGAVITSLLANTNICSSYPLVVNSNSSAGSIYSWERSIGAGPFVALTVTNSSIRDTFTSSNVAPSPLPVVIGYRAKVVNPSNASCSDTQSIYITVDTCSQPVIRGVGKDKFCPGENAQLQVLGVDTTKESIIWSTGETTQTINIIANDSAMYSVTVGKYITETLYDTFRPAPIRYIPSSTNGAQAECQGLAPCDAGRNFVWNTDNSVPASQRCQCQPNDIVTSQVQVYFVPNADGQASYLVTTASPKTTFATLNGKTKDTICTNQNIQTVFTCSDCGTLTATRYLYQRSDSSANITNNGTLTIPSGALTATTITSGSIPILGNTTLYVSTTNNFNCVAIDSIEIVARRVPTLQIQDTTKICTGASATLIAQTVGVCDACNYLWSTGETTQIISTSNAGKAYISVTSNNCVVFDSTFISVKPLPSPVIDLSATASGPPPTQISICVGQSDTLYLRTASMNPNPTLSWNTNATLPFIRITGPGGYYLQAADSATGCTALSNPIIVISAPTGYNSIATANPSNVCQGSAATLSVPPCAGCSYQWFSTASPTVSLASTRQFSTTSAPASFFAIVRNAQQCGYPSSIVTIQTDSFATPVITATRNTVCNSGDTVQFTALYNPSFQYQWYAQRGGNPNIPISAATSATYTEQLNFNSSSTNNYTLVVTYPNGCTAVSNSIAVSLSPLSSLVAPTNGSGTICLGDSIPLTTVSGAAAYSWFRNGVLIPNALSSVYYADQAGNYHAQVTNTDGCRQLTGTVSVASTNVTSATAVASEPNICSGDTTTLSVSICLGCQYRWYRNNTPIDTFGVNNYAKRVGQTGNYYAIVKNGNCQTQSNTVVINAQNVIVPSIITNSTEYCNGISPVLRTSSCPGCSYTWLRNGQPIYGALNDSFYTVVDTGQYRVAVLYASGCSDTSAQQIIITGGYQVSLTETNSGVVCNGTAITLTAGVNPSNKCAGGCLYNWFRNGSLIQVTTVNTITADSAGFYRVQVRSSSGCIQDSEVDTIREVIIAPIIQGTASSICGSNPIGLSVTPCAGCSYQWSNSSGPMPGFTAAAITVTSASGYTVSVSRGSTCGAVSPPYSLNPLASLAPIVIDSITGSTTATSSCAGNGAPLRLQTLCASCTYQWMIDSVGPPFALSDLRFIPGATLPNYSAVTAGGYAIVLRDTATNCLDTSNIIRVTPVAAVAGFGLDFAPLNQLAGSGTAVDLDTLGAGLTPVAQHTNPTGSYTIVPLFAYTVTNPGLSNAPRRDIFDPSTVLAGNYQVTYSYTASGCTFTTSSILRVLDAATVNISNRNPQSVPYEACVGDTLQINTANYAFSITSVSLFNQQDVYTTIVQDPLSASQSTLVTATFGSIVFAQGYRFVVPDTAKGCFVKLRGFRSDGTPDSAITPFLQIHNEPLSFSGLPNTICSNGNPITLTGTPLGGTFILQNYNANNPALDTNRIAAFTSNSLNPAAIPFGQYDSLGIDTMRVVYQYTSRYSNGNACPYPDTSTQLVVGRSVNLIAVSFNNISVSQPRERLENLVARVSPHTASPARWLRDTTIRAGVQQHRVRYGGSFTAPAGDPDEFLPANAGVGVHTLTYSIINGVCMNTVSNNITVLPAPSALPLADTICRNISPITFTRDAAYPYQGNTPISLGGGITFRDTFNTMVVSTRDSIGLPNRYLDTINGNVGLEIFRYTPRDASATIPQLRRDSILIQYWYRRVEFNGAVPFDTVQYVIASYMRPVFIEDTVAVDIPIAALSRVYCEDNTDNLVVGTPSGGVFSLVGGTGAYSTENILPNNILNPFQVHQNESANTDYVLIYTINGVACRSRDTFRFKIPEPISPAFSTASGRDAYCNSALPDTVRTNSAGALSAILLVNGVSQPRVGGQLFFTPTLTTPGPQLVIHQVTDSFGCVTEARDTFQVYPLPTVRIDTFATTEFCTNDSAFIFQTLPSPVCVGATGGELMREGFDLPQLPSGWLPTNVNSNSSGWGQRFVNGYGVAFIDTVSQPQNAWLFTRNIPMVAGGTYQIEYWMRVGPRNCPTCADAAMEVTVGQAQNPSAQATILANFPILDDNYAGFYALQSHSFIAPANGNYNFAFHAYSSGRTTRWISLDTVIVRQISAANCQNGIGSLSGAGIANIPGNDSTFRFIPSSVPAGNYTIKYTFSDTRSCVDSVVIPVVVKAHPTITMASLSPTYCNNAPAVPLNANPAGGVFNFIRTVGTDTTNMTLGGNVANNIAYNTSVDLRFTPRYLGTEIMSYRYRDPLNQCVSTIFDTVTVVGIPDSAHIISLDTAYCEGAVPTVLDVAAVNPRGLPVSGYFTGPGVLNGVGGAGVAEWKADSAVTVLGRVGNTTISYIYTASNGCVDTTRFTTRVQGRLRLSFDLVADSVRLPDSLCLNDPDKFIRVNHRQLIGAMGNVQVDSTIAFNQGIMTASGTGFGLGDRLQPANMGAGWHYVSYYFRNPDVPNCEATIRDSFRIDTVPVIFFTGLPNDRAYCENETGSLLLANPPYYPGSGYLQITNTFNTDTIQVDSSFYYIDPSQLIDSAAAVAQLPIHYDVFYTFTNLRGCTSTGTDTFQVRPFPRIVFNMDSVYCNQDSLLHLGSNNLVTPVGGIFSDNLPVSSIIQPDTLDLNSAAGPRRITYTYTNAFGCTDTRFKDVTLYHTPEINFTVVGGCAGQLITFNPTLANFDPSFDSITRVVWNFGDNNTATVIPSSGSVIPIQTHTYSNNTGYLNPTLTVTNQGFCQVSVSNPLLISPLIVLDRYAAPYVEDFQLSNGGWLPQQEKFGNNDTLQTDTTWQYADLLSGHIQDAGNKAWVTHATSDNVYNLDERAHVYSPCFDFTRTWRPMISLDVWRDMTPGIDGAILEAYNPVDNNWHAVGSVNKGQRWYQSDFLLSRPGSQRSVLNPTGWTGISNGWENARYRLDSFAGRQNVRFRISFATTPNTVLVDQPQGFAFDSVWIGERGRNVLIEHFTNYAYPDVHLVDQGLYSKIFNNYNGRDYSLIQYHSEVSAMDDQQNAVSYNDVSARSLFYGVQQFDNRALVDGTPRGDATTSGLDIDSVDLDMLQFPAFNVFVDPLSVNTATGEISVSASFQATKPMPTDDYRFYAVIVEDSIPCQLVNQNSVQYELMGVMRKMLPSPAGQQYLGSWWQGQQISFSESYTSTINLPSTISLLSAVVFIQNGDESNPEVYQVATTRDLTIYAYDSLTTVVPLRPNHDKETSTCKLFPNPAVDNFTVQFEQPLATDYQWQLVNVLGQTMQSGQANAGTQNIQIDTRDYPAASYFFIIGNDRVRTQRQVIIQRP